VLLHYPLKTLYHIISYHNVSAPREQDGKTELNRNKRSPDKRNFFQNRHVSSFEKLQDIQFLFFVFCGTTIIVIGEDYTETKVRYDTIRQKSLTWTGKLSIQLYLAHVARKRN